MSELHNFFFKPRPFWEIVPPSVWESLNAVSVSQSYPKKTIIYSEGSHPRGLYIIRKGRLKVFIIDHNGAELIIYFMGKNEFFGYRSIVCDEISPVYVAAIDDCVVDCIPRLHFERHLRDSPQLNTAFFYYLGHEFRQFVHKISVFAQKSVSERVALALLVLNEKFNGSSLHVNELNFSRENLAAYTGTAPESLIRQLKLLRESGAITVKGRKIVLEQPDLLWERAGLAPKTSG